MTLTARTVLNLNQVAPALWPTTKNLTDYKALKQEHDLLADQLADADTLKDLKDQMDFLFVTMTQKERDEVSFEA
jgi:hypothetical protein